MPALKPRNAVYKDSVVAYLALKAQIAIADDHPSDTNVHQLGKLMLLHDPQASVWKGEYYDASVAVMSHTVELKDVKGRAKEMDSIRNMLRECGEYMSKEERDMWGRKLYEHYKQNIEDNGASNA